MLYLINVIFKTVTLTYHACNYENIDKHGENKADCNDFQPDK